ncbi:MAG: Xanthosine triphosphate pyrophosphatase [Candidatus Parcubacteria bacterium]|nr:Xanthosine triphosphate pyrophosphatase [Candidatus Parcubacteria bacterium]
MKIILSTRNPSKALQIKTLFKGSNIEILTLDQAGIEGEVIEDGATLNENALKKARFAYEQAGGNVWTMADDTGLFINALGGQPGIKAARWAGETATTEEITLHTLKSLQGKSDRSATFGTVVAIISPEGKEYVFGGECSGMLLDTPRVAPQPKMPYSPLFVPDGSHKVWGEMSVEEENSISHRGKAFGLARNFLETQAAL